MAKAAVASGAVAKAQARAQAMLHTALEALAGVPMNGLTCAYRQLAEYAVSRRA